MTTADAGAFVCPRCRSLVEPAGGGYRCSPCRQNFPILFGIPDFRLRGDQYLSIEDERAKAGRLHDYAQGHDFASLVEYYYSITDDVPDSLAAMFAAYVLNGQARSAQSLKALAPDGGRALLDLGCGSGGALIAGEASFEERTGVDIALRWLVIAQARLREARVNATLVCADAEALPFADNSFSHVLANDLLENTKSPMAVVACAAAVLDSGGRLYVASSNRWWIGPHPATGVWAAGFLPPRFRAALSERKHAVDVLRAVSFVSPVSVARMARAAELCRLSAGPFVPEKGQLRRRPILFRAFAAGYSMLARVPVVRQAMLVAGPMFQTLFVKESAE